MIDYIPSKAVKKYMEFRNICLSDFEKAGLIYNAEPAGLINQAGIACNLESKHDSLKEIMEHTKDKVLQQQIAERLEEDRLILAAFTSNPNGAIYKVQTYDETGDNEEEQYFTTFEMADQCAREYMQKTEPLWHRYEIAKFALYEKGEKPTIDEEMGWWNEGILGHAVFNIQGKMIYLESNEHENRYDSYNCRNRFENHYIPFRNPFRAGDIVKNLSTGQYGVVAVGDEDYEKHNQFGVDYDYSDAKILVEYLYDDGGVCHDHPYPWELEYTHMQFEPDVVSPNIIEAMLCSVSELLKGGGYIEIMQDYSCEMAEMKTGEIEKAKGEMKSRDTSFIQSGKYDEMLRRHFSTLGN